MRAPLVLAAGLLAFAAWRMRADQAEADQGEGFADLAEDAMDVMRRAFGMWRAPAQYADAIMAAEARNGIPPRMLERLLYQESRYRADIISGKVRSPVGAIGIAQAMPETAAEWKFNPLDPLASIDFAGRYLAWLRKRHSSWAEALAAYNWGTGNVARKGLAKAPAETRAYFSQILADVNDANGTTYT